MTFLPIVERELRVAARRWRTYWIRPLTALLAILLCFLFLLIALASPNPGQLGSTLFQLLSVYAFGICLLAGVFVTSDAISTERREGTLGFLFLTDLHGYDVVLGKFTGRSLNAFYALLAIMPALALPLTLGGVTGTQFWHMVLALVNSLFLSLCAGIFVSVHNRDSFKSMLFAGGLITGLTALPALIPLAKLFSWQSGWLNRFVCMSPFPPYLKAFSDDPKGYWTALASSHVLGWLMLVWSSLALPRIWRTGSAAVPWPHRQLTLLLPERSRRRRNAEWREYNPIRRLAEGERSWHVIIRVLALAAGAVWLGTIWFGLDPSSPLSVMALWASWPFTLALKILMAVHSCRLFSEARRTGTLELLLTTPLTNSDILRGQWQFLKRTFLWPVIFILCCEVLSILGAITIAWSKLRSAEILNHLFISGFLIVAVPKLVADLVAIACLGTYLSLTMKKPNHAVGLTLLLVVFIPLMVPCILTGYLFIAVDMVFILWPLSALRQDVRALVRRG